MARAKAPERKSANLSIEQMRSALKKIERRIAAGSTEQIDKWTDRVISAATLAELFTD